MAEVIPIGSDHAGYQLKERLLGVAGTRLRASGCGQHNDANILIVPARFVSEEQAVEILKTWLEIDFAGGRHSRRVEKIDRGDR